MRQILPSILIALSIAMVGCAPSKFGDATNATQASEEQRILGHRVVKSFQDRMMIELQPLRDTEGKPTAVIPFTYDKTNRRYTKDYPDHIRVAFPGDDILRQYVRNSNELFLEMRDVFDRNTIAIERPHSISKYKRSFEEVDLQHAIIDYLVQEFGFKTFAIVGISSGGTIALSVLEKKPELVTDVTLISPVLAIKSWYKSDLPHIYHETKWQYDPMDYIHLIDRSKKITVYHDLEDKQVKRSGVVPWLERAAELGLNVDFRPVKMDGERRHVDLKPVKWDRRR